MLSIFRKGEEFNHGVEFVLLLSFNKDALGNLAEHALAALASMILESPSLIVQFTHGLNFSPSSKEYTHGVVIRFRSAKTTEMYGCLSSSPYSTNHCLFISLLIQWELKLCREDDLWFPSRNVASVPLLFRNKDEGYFLLFIFIYMLFCYEL
ncbi:hypothetical protein VNO77_00583 [Canavalia gladiata]|uniref:Uncharacterized protein n=1 Tax=Canavalia gladiata TaxID=3824 RepID=A0AAN9MPN8_CANGL